MVMRDVSQIEINEILRKHRLWLEGEKEGEQAAFVYCDLIGAVFNKANLDRAYFLGCVLYEADLGHVSLRGASVRNCNFTRANLSFSDLRGAIIYGDNIWINTNFVGANYDPSLVFKIPLACPEYGSFIAWKSCFYGPFGRPSQAIVKLQIPEDAKRSSATERKCRASKAIVLDIRDNSDEPLDPSTIVRSCYDPGFFYRVGETIEVKDFDEDRFRECAPGIHFFITKQEALNYR